MDALRKSVARVQKSAPEEATGKPPRKMAASLRKDEKPARKRKSG
jgi:hypothetical protein